MVSSLAAQPFVKAKLLVVPGKSIGPIQLGKPVPEEAFKLLGPGSGREDVTKITSQDGGGIEWLAPPAKYDSPYLRVKCHDGKKPENVFQVFWTVPGPRTANGVGVGSSVAEVTKKFPSGHWTTGMDDAVSWETKGLNFTFDAKKTKVYLMHLYKS